VPFTVTSVAPKKPLPAIETVEPIVPLDGEKLEIDGNTENDPAEVAVPAEVVTLILPLLAATGTVAVSFEDETSFHVAFTPPNATDFTLVKFLPVIVTLVLVTPDVGVNDDTAGPAATAAVAGTTASTMQNTSSDAIRLGSRAPPCGRALDERAGTEPDPRCASRIRLPFVIERLAGSGALLSSSAPMTRPV
jgi:hypothetical protein